MKWNTPTCGNYWAEADGKEETKVEEEDIPEWRGGSEGDPQIEEQLTTTQRSHLLGLLKEFADVLVADMDAPP